MVTTSSPWNAAVLQLALFTKTATPKTTDIYSALAGVSPDSHEDRIKEGIVRQTGMVGENTLQVGFNPLRIDVVLSPPLPEMVLGVEPRFMMGPFIDELSAFAKMVERWLPTF